MLQILHVIDSLDPAQGGPPAIAERLAAAQALLGHRVRLVTYADPVAEERTRMALGAVPCIDRVEITWLPPPSRREWLLAVGAGRRIARMLAGVDALHIHSVWAPINRVAASAARRAGVPYAVLLNGVLDPWSLAQRRLKKRVALALGYRRMLDGAAFLHAGNRDEARLIGPLGLRAPVEQIPNGVFLEELAGAPPPGEFRSARPRLGGRPFILFLSRLHYKKGLDFLAEAFALVAPRCPDHHLVVAGPDGGARADFEARIARHGLGARVHLTGPLYGRDKLGAMADADCFCLPSRQEGFSVAITEALACGLPVVISRDCHFPEVEAAGAGVVVELDAAAVADGLAAVLADKERRLAMGRAARRLIETGYTWPVIAARTVEAYRRAGAGSRTAALTQPTL